MAYTPIQNNPDFKSTTGRYTPIEKNPDWNKPIASAIPTSTPTAQTADSGFFTPTPEVRIRDFVRESTINTGKTIKFGLDVGAMMLQAPLRWTAGAGLLATRSTTKLITGKTPPPITTDDLGDPDSFFTNFIKGLAFGETPVSDIASFMYNTEMKVKETGQELQRSAQEDYKPELPFEKVSVGALNLTGSILEKFAAPLTTIGIPVIASLDFTPVGGGAGGKNLLIKTLQKSDDLIQSMKTLRQVGVAEDLVMPIAKLTTATEDSTEIARILDRVDEFQKNTKQVLGQSGNDLLKQMSETPDETIRLLKSVDQEVAELTARMAKNNITKDEALSNLDDVNRVLQREADALKTTGRTGSAKLIENTIIKNVDSVMDKVNISVRDYLKSVATRVRPFKIAESIVGKSTDEVLEMFRRDVVGYQETGLGFVGDRQPINPTVLRLNEWKDIPIINQQTKESLEQAIKSGEIKTTAKGNIQVYRVGEITESVLTSVAYNKKAAEDFALRAGRENLPIQEFTVNRDDVAIFIGQDEKELLIRNPKSPAQLAETRPDKLPGPADQLLRETLPQSKVASLTDGIKKISSSSLADTTTDKKILQLADQNLKLSSPELNDPTLYNKTKEILSNKLTDFLEVIQDSWIRVRNLQAQDNIVSGKVSAYELKQLMPGRIRYQAGEISTLVKNIKKDILTIGQKAGRTDLEFTDDVNQYLIARHAPERNARLGDGAAGMTNQTAEAIVAKATPEVIKVADKIQSVANQTLDILRRGRVISDDLYGELRTIYKNHVPLNRIMDEAEDFSNILTTRGFDVYGTGLRSAKGSERAVDDILTNVVTNLNSAIIRAEKNLVDLETLKLVRQNPEAEIATITRNPLKVRTGDPRVLTLMEDGKKTFVKFNDPQLAMAFRGINEQHLPTYLNFIRSFSRLFSSLHTKFNYTFPISNIFRDTQEAMIYVAANNDLGAKGAFNVVKNDPKSMKTISDFYFRKVENTDTALYRQMLSDGAGGGGWGIDTTRQDVVINLASLEKELKSKPRAAFKKVLDTVENWNTVFEDANRFSVYKEALARGLSRDEAAGLAKEATINFDRRGTAGPIINALYMFSNASIQGSTKILRAMKNPKVALATVSTVAGSVFTTSQYNDRVDPNWRKKVNQWDRNANLVIVLPTEEFSYITLPVSWGLKPIKVAADYAYDFSMNKSESTFRNAVTGIASSILEGYNPVGGSSFTQIITPTFLDVPVDVFANRAWHGGKIKPDWDQNAPASTQYFKSLEQELPGRIAIKIATGLSEAGIIELSPASMNYIFNQYIGGAGQAVSQTVDTIVAGARGELPMARQVPIMSRFLKSKTEEEVTSSLFREGTASAISEQEISKAKLKRRAENFYNEIFLKETTDVIQDKVNDLVRTDPQLANEVAKLSQEKTLDLKPYEKSLRALNVENGARAQRIVEMVNGLEGTEAKAKLLKDLTSKKIITESVANQMNAIWQRQSNPVK